MRPVTVFYNLRARLAVDTAGEFGRGHLPILIFFAIATGFGILFFSNSLGSFVESIGDALFGRSFG